MPPLTRYLTCFNEAPARAYSALYAVLATIIAVVLFFTYPAFKSPHEAQHYLRGLTFSTLYKDGKLPYSSFEHINHSKNPFGYSVQQYKPGRFTQEKEDTLKLHKEQQWPFTSHSNVAVYPFINYVPQIIAGTLGDLLNLPPSVIYHWSRALCLLPGIIIGYFILRLLPCYHVPMLVALLLPSSWVMRAQQYTDQTVILATFFFFALLMRVIVQGGLIRRAQAIGIFVLSLIIASSKVVYFPVVLGVLLLPKAGFALARHRQFFIFATLAASLLVSLLVGLHALKVDYGIGGESPVADEYKQMIPYTTFHTITDQERWQTKQERVQLILTQPLRVLSEMMDVYTQASFWHGQLRDIFIWFRNSYAGVLEAFGIYPLLLGACPFWLCLYARPASHDALPTAYARLVAFSIIASVVLLTALALYTGSPRGFTSAQGRYLTPLLPFVALMCSVRISPQYYARTSAAQALGALSVIIIFYLGIWGVL